MADPHDIWSPAKVFSPSVAKQQTSAAKDWNYVNSWLAGKFAPAPVPPFERNAATLRALLALATANDAADSTSALTLRVKSKAAAALRAPEPALPAPQEPLLPALEEHLTADGSRSLNSLALLSVALSTPPAADKLAARLLALTRAEASVAAATAHVDVLVARAAAELQDVRAALRGVEELAAAAPPPGLADRAREWARTGRVLRAKAEDYRERLRALEGAGAEGRIEGVARMEAELRELKVKVVGLEAQTKGFLGLPPEKDLARLEVERLEEEVAELEKVREGLYDRMT